MDLFQGNNLQPLTIGMSLMLLQQITGQPSVLYYAVRFSLALPPFSGLLTDADSMQSLRLSFCQPFSYMTLSRVGNDFIMLHLGCRLKYSGKQALQVGRNLQASRSSWDSSSSLRQVVLSLVQISQLPRACSLGCACIPGLALLPFADINAIGIKFLKQACGGAPRHAPNMASAHQGVANASQRNAIQEAYKQRLAGVAVLSVDSVGRRPLLLWGVGGMTVALLGLGGSSLALSGSVSTWSSVVALLLYVGAYQVFP